MGMMGMDKNSPRLVFWELTAGCNLTCRHCRAEAAPERLAGELDTDQCKKFIDELAELGRPILIMTGGEPLFRQDLFELAEYAHGKGFPLALATNGTLIDETMAKKIVAAGFRRVAISLDGSNAETHDSFRGIPGCFDDAIKGIKNLKALGMSTQINTTIARHNAHEIKDILDLSLELKADALHLFMLVPVGCGVNIAEDQMLTPVKYESLLNWFYKASREHPEIEMKATCAPHYYRILKERSRREGVEMKRKSHGMAAVTKGCLAGQAVFFVSRFGQVQPCGYLPLAAGNITETHIKEIWENSELFKTLRDPDALKGKCGPCEFKEVCMGCRARAHYETGDFMDEEPYCLYIPESLREPAKAD